jgi:hypothetical protein
MLACGILAYASGHVILSAAKDLVPCAQLTNIGNAMLQLKSAAAALDVAFAVTCGGVGVTTRFLAALGMTVGPLVALTHAADALSVARFFASLRMTARALSRHIEHGCSRARGSVPLH